MRAYLDDRDSENAIALHELRTMLAATRNDRRDDRKELKEIRKREKISNDARTATGCEDWVALAQLKHDMEDPYYWFNEKEDRAETATEVSWRIAYWTALNETCPRELFSHVEALDIRDVYLRMVAFNQNPSADQITSLNTELTTLKKEGMTMVGPHPRDRHQARGAKDAHERGAPEGPNPD